MRCRIVHLCYAYNELYLYLKQVNKLLEFLCVIRREVFMENRDTSFFLIVIIADPLHIVDLKRNICRKKIECSIITIRHKSVQFKLT